LLSSTNTATAKRIADSADRPSSTGSRPTVSQFAQAAEARADVTERDRRDYTLYIDEFQNFASMTFAKILSEARKWRLSILLAHQFRPDRRERLA
jgi:hypothetical protein